FLLGRLLADGGIRGVEGDLDVDGIVDEAEEAEGANVRVRLALRARVGIFAPARELRYLGTEEFLKLVGRGGGAVHDPRRQRPRARDAGRPRERAGVDVADVADAHVQVAVEGTAD